MKRKLKFKVTLYPCAKCGGRHTDWWKTTPPPSCEERQRHAAKS